MHPLAIVYLVGSIFLFIAAIIVFPTLWEREERSWKNRNKK